MAFEKVTVPGKRIPASPSDAPGAPSEAGHPVGPAAFRRTIPADARIGYWTAPDGWKLRRFDWPAEAPRGRLLFQTGRGDIFEKYLETLAELRTMGWSVTAFDWRGQGGSGRLSSNPNVGHASDFGVFDSDLAAFWSAWQAEDVGAVGPSVIMGHSMGGMMVMRALANRTIRPDAAILVAPMIGLKSPLGSAFSGRIAAWMARHGDPARAAWRTNERPGSVASRQALLTHDVDRYRDERWWQARNPELRLGPPSWSWLAQGFAGAAALAIDPAVESIDTPILMLIAETDKLVDSRAALRLAARLPNVQVMRFGRESAHEILREADGVRGRAMSAIASFLAACLPTRR
ncbi:alpha/beta hydrolase [Sphingomonas faeni]|uniref:alpha/beta hydrolase n=1 Tax=Sphingomonas faeni TaxID=185950 RepID=UPI00334FF9CF